MLSRKQTASVLSLSKHVCRTLNNRSSPVVQKLFLTNQINAVRSYSNQATSKPEKTPEQELNTHLDKIEKSEKRKENIGKVKAFFKKYGLAGVIIYFSLYFATLGALYVGISAGYIRIADVEKWIVKLGLDKWVDIESLEDKKNATNFAFAWIITKFTEPIRFAATLAITPYIIKLIKK